MLLSRITILILLNMKYKYRLPFAIILNDIVCLSLFYFDNLTSCKNVILIREFSIELQNDFIEGNKNEIMIGKKNGSGECHNKTQKLLIRKTKTAKRSEISKMNFDWTWNSVWSYDRTKTNSIKATLLRYCDAVVPFSFLFLNLHELDSLWMNATNIVYS